MIRSTLLCTLMFILALPVSRVEAQRVRSLDVTTGAGIGVDGYTDATGTRISLSRRVPLFTFTVNEKLSSSLSCTARREGDSIRWTSASGFGGSLKVDREFRRGWKGAITFRNSSRDTLQLANIVPLGEAPDHVYIRSVGASDLSKPFEQVHPVPPGRRTHRRGSPRQCVGDGIR